MNNGDNTVTATVRFAGALPESLSEYLPLSGGKLTGELSVDTIKGATLNNIIIRQNTTTGDVVVGSTSKKTVLVGSDNRPYYAYNDDGIFGTEIALVSDLSNYLPLSGGRLEGTLSIKGGVIDYDQYSRKFTLNGKLYVPDSVQIGDWTVTQDSNGNLVFSY